MKFFALLCVFVTIAYASAASIPRDDGPSDGLRRLSERDADPDAYADAISDAVASVFVDAGAFGDPNGVAFPDNNVNSRLRRFSCNIRTKWFSPNHSFCATKCLMQKRRGGVCQNGTCVCR